MPAAITIPVAGSKLSDDRSPLLIEVQVMQGFTYKTLRSHDTQKTYYLKFEKEGGHWEGNSGKNKHFYFRTFKLMLSDI